MESIERSRSLLNELDPVAIFENWWSYPFNGQARRIFNVFMLASALKPKWAIETGTYLGSSTWLFLGIPTVQKIWSIESQEEYLKISLRRHESLVKAKRIELLLGDSSVELSKLLSSDIPCGDSLIAYLDAHWYGDNPTPKEVQALQRRGGKWLAIVDDFKIEGEFGKDYGFDSYKGIEVSAQLFDQVHGFSIYCPNEPSIKETGWSRGTGYFISDEALTFLGPEFLDRLNLLKVLPETNSIAQKSNS